jgi:hypothetical protein
MNEHKASRLVPQTTEYVLTSPRWLPSFLVICRDTETNLCSYFKSPISLQTFYNTSHSKSCCQLLKSYRHEDNIRRLKWIIRRQQNSSVIHSTFKITPAGPPNREMPFEQIVLERGGTESRRRMILKFPHICEDSLDSWIAHVHLRCRLVCWWVPVFGGLVGCICHRPTEVNGILNPGIK